MIIYKPSGKLLFDSEASALCSPEAWSDIYQWSKYYINESVEISAAITAAFRLGTHHGYYRLRIYDNARNAARRRSISVLSSAEMKNPLRYEMPAGMARTPIYRSQRLPVGEKKYWLAVAHESGVLALSARSCRISRHGLNNAHGDMLFLVFSDKASMKWLLAAR